MKFTFKNLVSFLSTIVIMTVGWIGSLTFAQANISDWHISVPSIFISWIIFIPAYNYWIGFFTSLWGKEKKENI